MKRDVTVFISIGLLAVAWVIGSFYETPPASGDSGWGLYMFSMLLAILGMARAVLLWFQTLLHILKEPKPFPHGKWIALHIVAAPLIPYLYYFITSEPGAVNVDDPEPPAPETDMPPIDDHPES